MTPKPTTGKAASTEPITEAEPSSPAGEEGKAPPPGEVGGGVGEGVAAAGATTEAAGDADAPADAATAEAGPADGVTDTDAATDVDADLQAAADAVEVDLELLLSERAQYLDAYRRAQADFENYRKQAQKRQDDAVVRSLGRFIEGLLPVLDSCDAALAHGATEVEPVLTALYGALSKEGLERVDPKGAAFDPTEAEAVVHEPGEGGDQVVAEVLRPGYRWRGQVLRPAMVKVTD
ncbi:MAG TPA: nucleotide exchange factor GrpE [Acidimicrobiales bacterium]